MNDFITVAHSLLLNIVLPGIVTAFLPLLLNKGIGFLNQKQSLVKIQLSQEQEKFINQKVIDGIKFAEEQALKKWKSKDPELTSNEKLVEAGNYIESEVSGNFLNFDLEKKVEALLPLVRNELDKKMDEQKVWFLGNHALPENSRPPAINPGNNFSSGY